MRSFTIFAFIFIVVIAGAVAFAYFNYEKPKEVAAVQPFSNISIKALDGNTGQVLEANYTLFTANYSKQGKTDAVGFVVERLTLNNSFQLYLQRGGYYTDVVDPRQQRIPVDFSLPNAIRVERSLFPVGNISLGQEGRLGLDNPLNLTLSSNGLIKNTRLCLRWSDFLISVRALNATLADIPLRLQNKVDKCYDLNASLFQTSPARIAVAYDEYLPVTGADYINVTIVYGDVTATSQQQIVYEQDSRPVGKNGVTFLLR